MELRAEDETLAEAGRVLLPLCDTLSNIGAAFLRRINYDSVMIVWHLTFHGECYTALRNHLSNM